MTGDPFENMFGRPGAKTRFQERVARSETFGGRNDPAAGMAAEAASLAPEAGVYRAFGQMPNGNINHACEVRRWLDGTEVPEGWVFFYRLLLGIHFSGDEELRLMLPDGIIVIGGNNLDPLRLALARGQVTFIQQWNDRVWRRDQVIKDTIVRSVGFVTG